MNARYVVEAGLRFAALGAGAGLVVGVAGAVLRGGSTPSHDLGVPDVPHVMTDDTLSRILCDIREDYVSPYGDEPRRASIYAELVKAVEAFLASEATAKGGAKLGMANRMMHFLTIMQKHSATLQSFVAKRCPPGALKRLETLLTDLDEDCDNRVHNEILDESVRPRNGKP